jgi:hypothetical protein
MGYRRSTQINGLAAAELVSSVPVILRWWGSDNGAAVSFVQFFDAAAAADVTIGTTVPVWECEVGGFGSKTEPLGSDGIRFSTGLVAASTTTHWGGTGSSVTNDVMLVYD